MLVATDELSEMSDGSAAVNVIPEGERGGVIDGVASCG
jgi:hypothetical protein